MSFSTDVKDELSEVCPREKHCRLAELSALVTFYAKVEKEPSLRVLFPADNKAALRKCFTLLNKTYNINADIFEKITVNSRSYVVMGEKDLDIKALLSDLSYGNPVRLLDRNCCKRAYLRGTFIATGFAFEPVKSYQLEIPVEEKDYAELLVLLLSSFDISAKISERKKHKVVYVKGVETLSDTLNVLGAHRSITVVANARIVKDVRNGVNRRNNCDTANIIKAASAAAKQREDILLIQEKAGLDVLPEALRELADKRLEYPDVSLTELGELLDPPVGKSGVNHRFRKISEFADGYR